MLLIIYFTLFIIKTNFIISHNLEVRRPTISFKLFNKIMTNKKNYNTMNDNWVVLTLSMMIYNELLLV